VIGNGSHHSLITDHLQKHVWNRCQTPRAHFAWARLGFSSEVLKVLGKPADGDVISLKDGRDRLIGSAIYNSKSQIIARRFSRQRQDLDSDFFKRRIAQAAEYRARRHIDPKLCRVVWSESDGLPGILL
jgi:23S rRNA (cytosine1962-C5)-methyltransferase